MANISHLGVLSVLAQQTELSQSNTHVNYVHVVFKFVYLVIYHSDKWCHWV